MTIKEQRNFVSSIRTKMEYYDNQKKNKLIGELEYSMKRIPLETALAYASAETGEKLYMPPRV